MTRLTGQPVDSISESIPGAAYAFEVVEVFSHRLLAAVVILEDRDDHVPVSNFAAIVGRDRTRNVRTPSAVPQGIPKHVMAAVIKHKVLDLR